ncbi:MAG TPA: c-type cytochrome domain-containing protein [Polyangia bacterium]|nr:c-type cytochrome domain-containing protein [Polyangia bacterium]
MTSGNSLTARARLVGVLAGFGALLAFAGCGSTDDPRPATWSYIYPAIVEPSCATASCHSDIARKSDLDFGDKATAYDNLKARFFIIPGHSDQSEVVYLMRAQGARRMPPDFALPEADIQLFENWINTGADPNK